MVARYPHLRYRWLLQASIGVCTLLVTSSANAQTQSDGDCFGGCSGAPSYFGTVPSAIGSSLCPYVNLVRWMAMALAIVLSIIAAKQAAHNEQGSRKWIQGGVLLLAAGFLANPAGWLTLLNLSWLLSLVQSYYSCS